MTIDAKAVAKAYRDLFTDWCGHEMSVRGAAAECHCTETEVRAIVRWFGLQDYDAMVQVT